MLFEKDGYVAVVDKDGAVILYDSFGQKIGKKKLKNVTPDAIINCMEVCKRKLILNG